MGWEFRVFSPLESATALVDPSKQKECRSDTYVVVSDRVGLKYRHGSQLEVKTKQKISKYSQNIEKWEKHHGQNIENVESLLKNLKIYGTDEQEALAKMSTFKTNKRRKTWIKGMVTIEQTDIEVTIHESMKKWRSWCVEGSENDIFKWTQENCATLEKQKELFGPDHFISSYAAFVVNVWGHN